MALPVKKQGTPKKYFTGVCAFNVLAINPTKEQMNALGMATDNDPVYTGERDGVQTLRIDVFVSNPTISYLNEQNVAEKGTLTTKFSLWLENKPVLAKSGKKQFANKYAQFAYADSKDTLPDWFHKEGLREAFGGEETLYKFLQAWTGANKGYKDILPDECQLDTPVATMVTKGDTKELSQLVQACRENGNGIKLLLGVTEKDGNLYQAIYTKYFMRPSMNKFDKLAAEIAGEYGEFKADYQGSFSFQMYNPSAVAPITPDKEENPFQVKNTATSF